MDKGENAIQSGGGRRKGNSWLRLLLAVVIIAGVALIANQLGLFDMLKGGSLKERVERLDGMFQSLGAWAPVVFILIWISVLHAPSSGASRHDCRRFGFRRRLGIGLHRDRREHRSMRGLLSGPLCRPQHG